uniref:Endonuclease n=1 Tax=Juglanconis juglandina TaxID=1940567 RepID=A0A291LIT0_9PEZI|nr:endonuclease [Juglanconis juglandina]
MNLVLRTNLYKKIFQVFKNNFTFFKHNIRTNWVRSRVCLSTIFSPIVNRLLSAVQSPVLLSSVAKKELSGDYIAGLAQANGSFSASLTRKIRKGKSYFNLTLVFALELNASYKNTIIDLQKEWKNIGNWYLSKKNNTIRYQVKKPGDLLNMVIPFFMKYQLRDSKLISFLHFRYIVETVSSMSAFGANNRNVLLSLVVIASNMNPLEKLGNKIRYLKPEEQNYVINNIIPEGVDISKLNNSINNFSLNPLTLDFMKGLLETSTKNFSKICKQDQDNIKDNFLSKGYNLSQLKECYLTEAGGVNSSPVILSPQNIKRIVASTKPFNSNNLLSNKRFYSTKVAGEILPVKVYKNLIQNRDLIISENKGKAGIYRWINIEDGKCYVGSSKNLGLRLRYYLKDSNLISSLQKSNSIIYRSLLKYGYSAFSIEILEYCSITAVREREQYYIDRIKPEYNILTLAGSFLGYKHQADSKTKNWSEVRKAERLKQLETLNEKLKDEKLIALANWNKSEKAKENLQKIKENRSVDTKLFDTLNNETITASSIEEAAKIVGKDSSVLRLVCRGGANLFVLPQKQVLRDEKLVKKQIKEKGISRLINDRFYLVLDDYPVVQYKNPQLKLKIEVTDILTNKSTIYDSQAEAAKAIGSVSSNIANAMKKASPSPGGTSKLIKKRYLVKALKD